MDAAFFLSKIKEMGVDFYTGVPDSQLKALCDTLYESAALGQDHIIAANEGAAVGLAAGHFLASGRPAMVYMQNSGIGNAINPMASLMDERVYKIPVLYVVGWRGEPGIHDEPQHVFQGEITKELLTLMKVECFELAADTGEEEFCRAAAEAGRRLLQGLPSAFLVRKGGLEKRSKVSYGNSYTMTREAALEVIADLGGPQDIFVATTGKASRELYEIRERRCEGHEKDFLTVGSMGHASMIALGIALERPDLTVFCIDGDGAALMHLGSLPVLAKTAGDNLIHIVLNNQAHETVGGLPVNYGALDFLRLGEAAGYDLCLQAKTPEELRDCLVKVKAAKGVRLLEVLVSLGSRADLGRPASTPEENKEALMKNLLSGREK